MRILLAMALAASIFLPASHVFAADDSQRYPTFEDFIAPHRIQSMELSPDGRMLAAIGFNGTQFAVLLTEVDKLQARPILQTRRAFRAGVSYPQDPVEVHWISKDLLAVDFSDDESESVDLSGKTVAKLGAQFLGTLSQPVDSSSVLVRSDLRHEEFARVDPRTGARRNATVSLPGSLLYAAFDARGHLRAATMLDSASWNARSIVSQWYRQSEEADWQLLEQKPITANYWRPLFVMADNRLIIRSREGRTTWGVLIYDPEHRHTSEVLAEHPTLDVSVDRHAISGNFRRVTTTGLKPGTQWLDARWTRVQSAVDAALPNRINQLTGDPEGRVLVYSYSDIDPGEWFIADLSKHVFFEVGRKAPHLREDAMRPMQTLSYFARDGLTIPAYLTLPRAEGPPPLVVMIRGGPVARNTWSWDAAVQLLAIRGYAVFQPQIRGSAGFGTRLQDAGRGQWGLSMQNDITDGVRYLIDQKIVDSRRICIFGTGFGGYAALWGLAKTPELYRCGVSSAAMSDIDLLLEGHSYFNRTRDPAIRELLSQSFDVAARNGRDFSDVSPLQHADRIEAPVLLVHHEADSTIPPAHSKRMAAALAARNKPYQLLLLGRDPADDDPQSNQRRFHLALLDFLDRHIGPSSKVAEPGAQDAAAKVPAAAASASR